MQEEIYVQETIVGFTAPVLRVCAQFCDNLFSQCGSAFLRSHGAGRDRVDMEFENGVSFCQTVGLRVDLDDDVTCFSAARQQRQPSVLDMISFVAVAAMSLCLLRSERSTLPHAAACRQQRAKD